MGEGPTAGPMEPDGAPRIANLDILRGIAILGILFMNIPLMGATIAAAHSPLPSLNGWTAADQAAWWARQLFATGTARGLLELLFGAGMVILTARYAEQRSGWRVARRYAWRMAVLFLFGAMHVWLLSWPGDVLTIYAVAALVAFPFRRLRPRWLFLLGSSFALYATITNAIPLTRAIGENAAIAQARIDRAAGRPETKAQKEAAEGLAKWHAQVAEMRAAPAKEARERLSGLAGWRAAMWKNWQSRYQGLRALTTFWEAAAAMLIGAGLFKLGILQGRRSRRFYARMAIGWYAIGLSIRFVATLFAARMDDTVTLAWALDEVGRLTTTLGHVGLINWLAAGVVGARLLRPFAAAGRTALTLYILQTILCLWLIYPPFGLGWFGTQGWAGLMATAVAVDAGLLILANWWVRRYRIAPVEWAWRSLVERRALAWRPKREGPAAGVPLPA